MGINTFRDILKGQLVRAGYRPGEADMIIESVELEIDVTPLCQHHPADPPTDEMIEIMHKVQRRINELIPVGAR